MKIGVYTDVHCAYNSSILPLHCEGSKYTTRLQMIIDTFKWMYQVFEENGVDLIVNCGDLFDSYQVRAEEISALAEALSYGGKIPEMHILGNHEIFDKRRNFYATALLDNYPHIEIVNVPKKLDNGLSFLPYMPEKDVSECIELLQNRILFSHIDIEGSAVTPTYILDQGIPPYQLSDLFDLVINGHLHSPQSWQSKIFNIGASTSLSFSDNSDYVPHISIVDSDSLNITYFQNPHAIRFIKLEDVTAADVQAVLSRIRHRAVIRVRTTIDEKPKIVSMLEQHDNVVASRIITEHKIDTTTEVKSDTPMLERIDDIDAKFVEFLQSSSELKYPLNEYLSVINDVCGGAENEN